MSITLETDHDQLAQDVLISPHRDGERIVSLVSALALGVQAYEDEAFDTLVGTPLDVATGGTLDQWAALLSENRGTLLDDQLRELLQTRLLALRSTGSVPDIIAIWVRLNPDAISTRYDSAFPAGYRLSVITSSPYDPETIARIVRIIDQVRPAAIIGEYVETVEGGFRFDDGARGFDRAPMGRRLIA